MKNTLLPILSILFMASTTHAQPRHEVSMHHSWLPETTLKQRKDWVGLGYHEKVRSISFGAQYRYLAKSWLAYHTGISYSPNEFDSYPAPTGQERTPTPVTVDIISVPLGADLYFLRYFFVSGSVNIDIDVSPAQPYRRISQTGLGYSIGVGGQYVIVDKFRIFVNPFFKQAGVVSFTERNDALFRLSQTGLVYGVGYRF